jgi:DNA-binding beta-propeller fold protein YncE
VVGLGAAPVQVLVDERRARVFVLTTMPVRGAIREQRGFVDVLSASSGMLVRRVSIEGSPQIEAVDERLGRVYVASQLGVALASGASGSTVILSVLGAEDGKVAQVIRFPGGFPSLAVEPTAGRVYLTNSLAGAVVVYRPEKSGVVRFARGPIPVGESPDGLAVDGRRHRVFVYAVGHAVIDVLDARSVRVVRRVAAPQILGAIAVDEPAGLVYVATQYGIGRVRYPYLGRVTVAHAATGRRVCSALVGRAPEAVAVDAVAGRVYVAASGSDNLSVFRAPRR